MNKQVLASWNVHNIAELLVAITEAVDNASAFGHHPSTVYPNKLRLALVEETLSDGSTVLNLAFHDGCPA